MQSSLAPTDSGDISRHSNGRSDEVRTLSLPRSSPSTACTLHDDPPPHIARGGMYIPIVFYYYRLAGTRGGSSRAGGGALRGWRGRPGVSQCSEKVRFLLLSP